jgi:NADH:ubiquinone oxidoreductase subunit C
MLKAKNDLLTQKTKYYIYYLYNILYNFIYGMKVNNNQINLYIKPLKILNNLIFLKYNNLICLNSLVDIAVVDYISLKNRFEINYVFWNVKYSHRLIVKIYTDGINLVYSIGNLYKAALWLEREAWDLYGIKFFMHKGLRRILTDYGFKGFPLRKDFPLIGYVDVFYDDSMQLIKVAPIELAQSLRFYKFENPWMKWYF